MKTSKYLLLLISSISLFSTINALDNLEISERTLSSGGREFSVRFPDENRLTCESDSRPLIHKPKCTYWERTLEGRKSKEVSWENWFILRELFDAQEKRAKQELKDFEEEFRKMKEAAKSEANFIDEITNRLTSSLKI